MLKTLQQIKEALLDNAPGPEGVAHRKAKRRSPNFEPGDDHCGICQGDGYDINCGGHPEVCRCVLKRKGM